MVSLKLELVCVLVTAVAAPLAQAQNFGIGLSEVGAGILGFKKGYLAATLVQALDNGNNNRYNNGYNNGYSDGYSNNGYYDRRRGGNRRRNRNRGGNRNRYNGNTGGIVIRLGRDAPDREDILRDRFNQVEGIFYNALQMDHNDCVKKFVCLSNAPETIANADSTESATIRDLFGLRSASELDLSSATVRLSVAALIGGQSGAERCSSEYASCPSQLGQLLQDVLAGEMLYEAQLEQQQVV